MQLSIQEKHEAYTEKHQHTVDLYFTGQQAESLSYLTQAFGHTSIKEFLSEIGLGYFNAMADARRGTVGESFFLKIMGPHLEKVWFSEPERYDWKDTHPVIVKGVRLELTSNQAEVLHLAARCRDQSVGDLLSHEAIKGISTELYLYSTGGCGKVPSEKAAALYKIWAEDGRVD